MTMKRILIVDDSPTIRKLIGYVLKKKGYLTEAQLNKAILDKDRDEAGF